MVLRSHLPGCRASNEEGAPLARAQNVGVIRRDVLLDDIVCLVTAISLAVADEARPKARIERLVGLFLDGIAHR